MTRIDGLIVGMMCEVDHFPGRGGRGLVGGGPGHGGILATGAAAILERDIVAEICKSSVMSNNNRAVELRTVMFLFQTKVLDSNG